MNSITISRKDYYENFEEMLELQDRGIPITVINEKGEPILFLHTPRNKIPCKFE